AMEDNDAPADGARQVISSARATERAIQHLCRTTITRPSMTPAEVDMVLAHLADAAAAFAQAARQLGGILTQATQDSELAMDSLTETEDPDLAIDAALAYLNGVGEAALGLYRLLDAAHNETAHIGVADPIAKRDEAHLQNTSSRLPRPGDRQHPSMAHDRFAPGLRW
ncbi:MAG: hypothetical protein M3Y73_04435, partial [Actinomycetota bacterium]|nr:hypothetical protein [Actinomycetota bacterium]